MEESILMEKCLSPEEKKQHRRDQLKAAQAKRRMLGKEKGLCGICAKNPAAPGAKTCQKCYARVLVWQAKHRGKQNG